MQHHQETTLTTPKLESYAAGRWFAAQDDGTPIADAVTGEIVTRIGGAGPDVAGMVDHARTVGGPVLRELTFHQQAELLRWDGRRTTRRSSSNFRCAYSCVGNPARQA